MNYELSGQVLNFNNLDEEKKLKKVIKVFYLLRKVADLQLSIIKKHKDNKNIPKEIAHHYLYITIEKFWNKVDFFFSLRNNKYRKHNGLIIRSILEQLLQLSYFTLCENKTRNKIVFQEIIRINKRFYDRCKNEGEDCSEWCNYYKNYLEIFKEEAEKFNFPNNLDDIKEGQLKSYPHVSDLCKLTKKIFPKSDIDKWYDDYRYFCEETHNGLLMNWEKDEKRNYRQNLMYCLLYGRYIIEQVDCYYLKCKTKNEVIEFLKMLKYEFKN